jgi:DNA primase
MLTIGPGGGVISVLAGWRAGPLIVVEGLFDALSLAVCGHACVATIGRWVPWLPDITSGRTVWLAFDAGRSGDAGAARLSAHLQHAEVRRIHPPGRSKDWNTALVKRGRAAVGNWLQRSLTLPR